MTLITVRPPTVDESRLLEVVIDPQSVAPVLPDYDDGDDQYTVVVNTPISATGTLAAPDQKFRVPFIREDTGRKVAMEATVVGGSFNLNMLFPTAGKWVVNTAQINSELSTPMFKVNTHTFYVMAV